MKVEQSQVTKLVITGVERHDPIHIYLEDCGDNQNGRVTISEWGKFMVLLLGFDGQLTS